jgi:hypothetical protein
MKDQLTIEDLAPYLPYGLMGVMHGGVPCKLHSINVVKNNIWWSVDYDRMPYPRHRVEEPNRTEGIPILRPMSDLTNPIVVPGFNEGKEFVPIHELFQMAYLSVFDHKFDGVFEGGSELSKHLALAAREDVLGKIWHYGFTIELPNQFLFSANGDHLTIPNFTMHQMLYRWHFDINNLLARGLAIDINEIKSLP